jgi:hypothetical protein
MNFTGFTEPEKLALLDLLVLGMYADGHLAAVEDARLQRLLDAMELTSDHAKQKAADASVTRVSRLGGSADAVRAAVAELAKAFSAVDVRHRACDALDDLLSSDDKVTDREKEFLCQVRPTLQA